MKRLKVFLLLIALIGSISCEKSGNTPDAVHFDTSFSGARLDSVSNTGNNTYMAYINPAFEPVNSSPWFAFGVSSKSAKEITVTLNYGKYKHRYMPKLSTDKLVWTTIDEKAIRIDENTGIATLNLSVSPQKIYVAAQEIASSSDTDEWMDDLLVKNSSLKKVVAGKSSLNKNIYCLVAENEAVKNTIVLVARQHPPEIPGGTIGFKAFFEALIADDETARTFVQHYNIYAFPVVNPDGVDMGNWRHNANGVDLNRDWADFTQPETSTVKNFISAKVAAGKKIQFGLDFHTSYSGPYMLVLDSINELTTKKVVFEWIQGIETSSEFSVEARRRSQELPYCYNYFFNQFGCEAVTYEEGDEIDREVVINRAKTYANELMKTLLKKEI